MTSYRSLTWHLAPATRPWISPLRRLTALTLRRASLALARLARQLAVPAPPPAPPLPEVLEFYADAGAPEGALYLDGQLVGHLPGVTRL